MNRHPYRLLAAVISLISVGMLTVWFFPSNISNQNLPASPSSIKTVTGRYLFSGTVVLGRGVEQQARVAGGYDYNHPFAQFNSFNPEQYDGWMVDLECPVTTNTISFRRQVDELQFNCRPEWLPELTKYIQFINLANNHTGDMGSVGFTETQKTLDTAGVQTVGNFNPAIKKDICEVMALPIKIKNASGAEEQGTLPVAFCAWNYFFAQPQTAELETMKRYAEIMPVFTFMHVGAEYYSAAAQNQVDVARSLVDLGGEFVIGNSPHWVQNSEVYKDKLIIYSTGNFIFDQLDSETNRGLSMDVSFASSYDKNMAAWLKLGVTCKVRGDDCLERAKQQGLKKIKLEYNYKPVASAGGYKEQTRRGDEALQSAVEQRLNWTETMQKLKETSSP